MAEICYRPKSMVLYSQKDIKELFSSVNWGESLSGEDLTQAMKMSSHSVFAYDGNRIIGIARSMDDNLYSANIDIIVVHKDYQQTGIGTRLLSELLDQIKHIQRISIAPDDKWFFKSCERFGFKEVVTGGFLQKLRY